MNWGRGHASVPIRTQIVSGKRRKARPQSMPRPSSVRTAGLEIQFSYKLNSARVVSDAVVDAAENRRRQNRRRIVERWMVRKVSDVGAQIEIDPLGNSEFLQDREIKLIVNRRDEVIASGIPDRARGWLRELGARSRIEPEIAAGFDDQTSQIARAASTVRC